MPLRPCLDCGTPTQRTRCPAHTRALEAARPPRRAKGRYDARWVKLRAIAIRNQPWCSGYERPPHPSNDLTGDHRDPLGGETRFVRLEDIDVLCRSCNAAKRDRVVVGG